MSEESPLWGSETEELMRTAYHEAGHAVLQIAMSLGCKGVTIEPDYAEMTAGWSEHGGEWGNPATALGEEDDDTASLRMYAEDAFFTRHAIMCYAGAEAVRQLDQSRDDWRDGAEDDYRRALFMIDDVTHGDEQSAEHLRAYALRRAEILVAHYWPEIDTVAKALLVSKQLNGEAIAELWRNSISGRRGRAMSY